MPPGRTSSCLIGGNSLCKPSFREAWQQHRCVIPASYYFEWEHLIGSSGQKKVGDKFMLQPKNETMTWLAGIYRMEEPGNPLPRSM